MEDDTRNSLKASSQLLPLVAKAVKLSQDLPTTNTPAYIYYNDFPKYRAVTAAQSKRILSIIQNTFDLLDAKANVLDVPTSKNPREKFSSIVDANDKLLERLSRAMDCEEDPGRKASSSASDNLVVAVYKNQLSSPRNSTKSDISESAHATSSSDRMLRLITSKTVRRPQSTFTRPPDNSASLFRPNLAYKPNSIHPFTDSLYKDLANDEEAPHPYAEELEEFAHTIDVWKPIVYPHTPTDLGPEYRFVDEPALLCEVVKELSDASEIAVDLEHHSHRTYLGITCLIQISTRQMDYIIDALALRDHLQKLNEVFTNPHIVKIFHGSDCDLMWLQRDFSVYVVNLFDTGLAARALQLGRFSLSHLLQRYVNVRTDKKYQLADWRLRPLPQELIEYARTDTHYLIPIAAKMCEELQDRNLLSVVLERGRQLCLMRYTKPVFDPLGYWGLYKQTASTTFTHRHLYALEHLYALRDSIARREDESVHYVLPNHMLKVIAEVLPRESSGLFACCNPIPPLVRKYVHDLHKIVLDARNRPLEELPISRDPQESTTTQQDSSATAPDDSLNTSISGCAANWAPPHDHSFVDTASVSNISPNRSLLKKSPSVFGQVFCASSRSRNLPNCGKLVLYKFPDVDRNLLSKLLDLLAKPVKLVSSEPSSNANVVCTGVTAAPESAKNPAETIIPLNMMDEAPDSTHPPPSGPAVDTKLGQNLTKEVRKKRAPDPASDEVLILREEMTGRSKRRTRNRKKVNEADSSSTVAQDPVNSSHTESADISEGEVLTDSTESDPPTPVRSEVAVTPRTPSSRRRRRPKSRRKA